MERNSDTSIFYSKDVYLCHQQWEPQKLGPSLKGC